jgi:hypothetical protein
MSRRGRVQFALDASEEAAAISKRGRNNRARSGRSKNRRSAVDNVIEGVSLRLLSAEGDVFLVPASTIWHHSVLIRNIVEDSGPDEEIPLPGVTTRCLGILLDILKDGPKEPRSSLRRDSAPRGAIHELELATVSELTESIWAAQLLVAESTESQLLSTLTRKLEALRPTFVGMPTKTLLLLLRKGPQHTSAGMACDLINAVPHEASSVEALGANLDHPAGKVVAEAAEAALLEIGTLHALRAVLMQGSYSGRAKATRSLQYGCTEALDMLLELLHCMSWQVRETAILALSLVAPRGEAHLVERLAEMLEDPTREVRNAAVRAFRTMAEPDDAQTIQSVSARLGNSAWPVQCATLNALQIVAPSSPEMIEGIAQRLKIGVPTFAKHLAAKILKNVEKLETETQARESGEEATPIAKRQTIVCCSRAKWVDMDDDKEEADEM